MRCDAYALTRVGSVVAGIALLIFGWYLMEKHYYSSDFSNHFTQNTKTYYIGRFTVELPDDLDWQPTRFMVHHVEIKETPYDTPHAAREQLPALWKEHITHIKQLPIPREKSDVLIRQFNFSSNVARPAYGVYYYGNRMHPRHIYLSLLAQSKTINTRFIGWSKYPERMTQRVLNTVRHYKPGHLPLPNNPDSFFTPYGRVDAPWNGYEETDSYFTGGTEDIELSIETTSLNRPPEESFLIKGYKSAPFRRLGINASQYRLRKRTLAGMTGEEAIFKLEDPQAPPLLLNGKPSRDVNFIWRFEGEEKSGTRPWIEIRMYASSHNLKQKLALWDSILHSFQPVAWVTHMGMEDYDYDVDKLPSQS